MGLTEGNDRMTHSRAGLRRIHSTGLSLVRCRVKLTSPDDHDEVDRLSPLAHVERTRLEVDLGVVLLVDQQYATIRILSNGRSANREVLTSNHRRPMTGMT